MKMVCFNNQENRGESAVIVLIHEEIPEYITQQIKEILSIEYEKKKETQQNDAEPTEDVTLAEI